MLGVVKMKDSKHRSVLESFEDALRGIAEALRSERNMRIHFCAALIVVGIGLLLGLNAVEMAILTLVVALVITAELFNTAIERMVDIISPTYHALAAKSKEIAAGAVLFTSLAAVVIGFFLFAPRLAPLQIRWRGLLLSNPFFLTASSILVVAFVVIAIKAMGGKMALQGGMPSFHAAVSFALATLIFFFSTQSHVVFIAFVLALLVIQSRVEAGIHTILEVIIGSMLGTAIVTFLVGIASLVS